MRALSWACAIAGALYLAVTFTPIVGWSAMTLGGRPDPATGSRVLVVLAASGMEAGLLGESSYWRCAFAVQELRHHHYQRVILTGGGYTSPPIAVVMRSFLIASGVPSAIIEIEEKSTSTHENANFTAALLQGEQQPVALLTSDYHMYRSARLFRKAGVRIVRRPYPDAAARAARWQARWEVAVDLGIETAKIAYYKVRRWI
jgi:uncharacterized SAM-binding protein YcdF (DUF218 family)